MTKNNESFADLFEESMEGVDLSIGSSIMGEVIDIDLEFVTVLAGLKSEAKIKKSEFLNAQGELDVKIGDKVEVVLENLATGTGETKLSREKARALEYIKELDDAYENSKTIIGRIVDRVRGGFIVIVNHVNAFLPGSLLDNKPVQDPGVFENKDLELKVVKIDKNTNNNINIVVSRRAVLDENTMEEKKAFLATLHEGDVVTGTVKNITAYGAFIDLGGFDGLLHITDISWKRIKHPNEVLKLGDTIKVKVTKFDHDKGRVSLGLKQLTEDPWDNLTRRYPIGSRAFGKVTNIADYGFFVEIEPGIEGLVHISEIDWTNKNVVPSKIVAPGQEVEIMILEIDEDKRRISMGMKQCKQNPWKAFADKYQKGDKITGKIKSITDFGLFLGLEGSIDGLIHLTDLSWNEPGDKAIRNYNKGDEVEAVVLAIDPERERISLGIKQLEGDVYSDFYTAHPKGSVVTGKVTAVTAKEAIVDLGEEMEGKICAADVSRERVQDVSHYLSQGDEIEAKVMGVDRKGGWVNLSIKALQSEITGGEEGPSNTQLGDLLKEQMQEEDE